MGSFCICARSKRGVVFSCLEGFGGSGAPNARDWSHVGATTCFLRECLILPIFGHWCRLRTALGSLVACLGNIRRVVLWHLLSFLPWLTTFAVYFSGFWRVLVGLALQTWVIHLTFGALSAIIKTLPTNQQGFVFRKSELLISVISKQLQQVNEHVNKVQIKLESAENRQLLNHFWLICVLLKKRTRGLRIVSG